MIARMIEALMAVWLSIRCHPLILKSFHSSPQSLILLLSTLLVPVMRSMMIICLQDGILRVTAPMTRILCPWQRRIIDSLRAVFIRSRSRSWIPDFFLMNIKEQWKWWTNLPLFRLTPSLETVLPAIIWACFFPGKAKIRKEKRSFMTFIWERAYLQDFCRPVLIAIALNSPI